MTVKSCRFALMSNISTPMLTNTAMNSFVRVEVVYSPMLAKRSNLAIFFRMNLSRKLTIATTSEAVIAIKFSYTVRSMNV